MLSLAVGSAGTVFAEKAIDSVFNTPTGDFVFVTDYMHKTNRNEITDVNALLKGGNVKRIYALDPSVAIQREIAFLNSERGKEFYGEKKDGRRLVGKFQNFLDRFYRGAEKDEQRLKLISRYQNFLNELKRQNIVADKKSLEALSLGVGDGMLYPKEFISIKDGIYAIVKEGHDSEVGDYTVLYLTRLVSETTPTQYQAKIKELENNYNDLVKKEEEERRKLSELEQKTQTPELPLILPEPPAPKEKTQAPETKKEKDYRSVWLQAQQTANGDLTSYITSVGARVNPFKDADISFGANLDVGFGLDNLVDSYTGQLSAGRTASGTITDTNKLSIGGSLEAQFGPFILGGGIDYKTWVRNVVEQILDVKSNNNSTPNRQVFGKAYGGIEVPLGDNVKLGVIGGYNGKDGAYFGIRGGVKIK